MKSLLALFISVFCLSYSYAQSITGSNLVCTDLCEEYQLVNGTGGPYVWKIEGGEIAIEYQGNSEVEICWSDVAQDGSLSVLDRSSGQETTMLVTIINNPSPDIYFPDFPTCYFSDSIVGRPDQELSPLECISACAGHTASYTAVNTKEKSELEWTVTGAVSTANNQTNTVQVTWPQSGFGTITLQESNEAGCEGLKQYCVEILENPNVTITASASDVCIDQSVYIDAVSDNADDYAWIYMDEILSNTSQLVTSFETSGSQTISLITKTDCQCADTSYVTINVLDDQSPTIDCITPTYINEENTYYAVQKCGQYNWAVGPQGTIVDGGGIDDDFVTVVWTDGPRGELSLSVSGCDDDICQLTNTEYIPVIIPNMTIEGADEACYQSQNEYHVPLYPGTSYTWRVSGAGYVIDGQRTNQVTIQWSSPFGTSDEAIVSVEYENCLLECSGRVEKVVTLLREFELGAETDVACEGESIFAGVQSGQDYPLADISVYNDAGDLVQSFDDENFIYFDLDAGSGSYRIEARIDDGYCNNLDVGYVEVLPRPDAITEILGPLNICKGETYAYEHGANLSSNQLAQWSVLDGGSNYSYSGNRFFHTWTSDGPYQISVRVRDLLLNCSSEEYQVTINSLVTGNITGDDVVCVEETGAYTLEGVDATTEWDIEPASAGSIYLLSDNKIEVTWYEEGTHTLIGNSCGSRKEFNVEILPRPVISLTYNSEVCEGETTRISVSGNDLTEVIIRDENNQEYANNSSIPSGYYVAEVTNSQGCSTKEQFRVDPLPLPETFISTPDQEGFCPPLDPDRKLYALNTEDGNNYQWYKDGSAYGRDNPILTTSEFGTYYVEITDRNGCVSRSNNIVLYEYCGGECGDGRCSNVGDCLSNDAILMSGTNLGYCNEFQFSNNSTSGHDPNSLYWHFDDRNSLADSTSTLSDPTHTFSSAGFYEVILFGRVPDLSNPGGWCLDYDWEVFEVPVAANFYAQPTCYGEVMQLENTSTFIPGRNIVSYLWDFGDVGSTNNSSTEESPMHTFSAPGTYTVSLVITSDSGCLSRIEKEVEVLTGPDLDFDLPVLQCVSQGIKFDYRDDPLLSSETWTIEDPFVGTRTVESNVAIYTFENEGTYNISFSANNIYGCRSTVTKPIIIDKSDLSGEIVADRPGPYCPDDVVTLSAPSGASLYYWSNGETTSQIEVKSEGIYNVTVTGNTACDYVTEKYFVDYEEEREVSITGYLYEDNPNSGTRYTKEMDVCIYEVFAVAATWVNGGSYSWNVSTVTGTYVNDADLRALGVGRHEITVSVVDPATSCLLISDPFILNIHDYLDRPEIYSDSPMLCEGEPHILSVRNPVPGVSYHWNTGEYGTEIEVATTGSYYVRAVNEYGCSSGSNSLYVNPTPDAQLIPSGCYEVCFPFDVCVPSVNSVNSYQWYKDGELYGNVSSSPDLVATESGDYQLRLETFAGCVSMSDVMTLYPEPVDHSVEGTVFLDDNDNELLDTGEQLVEGAKVYWLLGNVRMDSTLTDANGNYKFEDIDNQRIRIEVDISDLNLDVPDLEYLFLVEFERCQDEQDRDVPINIECPVLREQLELFSCNGQVVEYEGNIYNLGDIAEIVFVTPAGCDSIIDLVVSEIPLLNLILDTNPSCYNSDSGTLVISSSDNGASYSLDGSPFTANTSYDNLSSGSHTVDAVDSYGCISQYLVEIETSPLIEPDIVVIPSCEGEDNGRLELFLLPDIDYWVSVDNQSAELNQMVWTDLSAGGHTVVVVDQNNCQEEFVINIPENEKPDIVIVGSTSCPNASTGTIEVQITDPGNFQFALDNGSLQDNNTFENLNPGSYTIWFSDGSDCMFSNQVVIEETSSPDIDFVVSETCPDLDDGIVEVLFSGQEEYMVAVDNQLSLDNQNIFENLSSGVHAVIVTDDGGCDFEYQIEIETYEMPDVLLSVNESCSQSDNGSIVIDADVPVEYSFDMVDFYAESEIGELPADIYTLYLRSQEGCITEQEVEVTESAELSIDVEEYELDCSISSMVIEPEVLDYAGELTYEWSNGLNTSNITVDESGTYSVEISDNCDVQTFEWTIDFGDNALDGDQVYMPNMFSPTSVAPNNMLRPFVSQDIELTDYKFEVYDRWGNQICESASIEKGWEGDHLDKNATSGVYIWMYEIGYEHCGKEYTLKRSGDVTMIR